MQRKRKHVHNSVEGHVLDTGAVEFVVHHQTDEIDTHVVPANEVQAQLKAAKAAKEKHAETFAIRGVPIPVDEAIEELERLSYAVDRRANYV
jgi:hypothetical protein